MSTGKWVCARGKWWRVRVVAVRVCVVRIFFGCDSGVDKEREKKAIRVCV